MSGEVAGLSGVPDYRMQWEFFWCLTLIDDVIMSSSPACVIAPIMRRLGVGCVATDYDCGLDTGWTIHLSEDA